jgi:PAS domain S-box-containing protein
MAHTSPIPVGATVPGAVLQRAVDEAARLLSADGAIVYVLDVETRTLRWGHDSGISSSAEREWLRSLELAEGVGMFGQALAEGRVVVTDEYLPDQGFEHSPLVDGFATDVGLRSLVVAPRIADGERLGAMGAYTNRRAAFGEREVALMRALADHAAAAMTNARLIEQLACSTAELRRSEERYRYLLENSPDLVWSADEEGRFTFLSETVERLTGWKPHELLGRHFAVLVHATSAEEAARIWNRCVEDPSGKAQFRLNARHRDGHPVPTEVHAVAIQVDGRFAGAHGSVRDMSERDRLERDLRRQEVELAAEWERANLARELHDSVTQALFSMTLTTRSAEMLLQRDPAAAAEKLAELRDLGRDALAEMRALIFELRPGGLEQDGLVQALRTHAASVQSRTGLPVAVEADWVDRLPDAVENGLYRIGQEALHNVVKHASAAQARIELALEGDVVRLAVEDDGHGFDSLAVSGDRLGLAGMRARAERIGGALSVRSERGEGTRVEVSVPLTPSQARRTSRESGVGQMT